MVLVAKLEFELAYNDVTVQHVSHYTIGTPSPRYKVSLI